MEVQQLQFIHFFKDLFILERERMWQGAEGEGESQADSLLSAEPSTGLDLRTLRS